MKSFSRGFSKGFSGRAPRRAHNNEPLNTDVEGFFVICFGFHDPQDKTLPIFLEQHESKESFKSGVPYIARFRYDVPPEQYDTYFRESLLRRSGKTMISQAVSYLRTIDGTDDNRIDFSSFTLVADTE